MPLRPCGRFGDLGEYLLVTPREGERVDKAIGMVPVRISISVTLRELRPLAGPGIQWVGGRGGRGWVAPGAEAPGWARHPMGGWAGGGCG